VEKKYYLPLALNKLIMTLNTILFLSILTIFNSCNGQIKSETGNKVFASPDSTITIGDMVPGLSEAIMVIYQDKMNNYWFGSREQGVFKYDGKSIKQFTMKQGLVSNDIWDIQEDKSGNMYFDTQDGVSKFDGQTFSTLVVSNSPDSEWKSDPDDLWFKGNWNINGPYRFDGKNLHHLAFPKNKLADELHANFPNMTWSPYGIYSLYKDSKGNIWFGTSNLGIYRFDGKSLSWMYEKHLTLIEGGGSFGIRSIIEDKDGKFWFCNTSYRYNILPNSLIEQDKILIDYKREKGIDNLKSPEGKDMIYFMSAIEDNKGDLWMLTYEQGVWRYDPSASLRSGGKTITHYAVKDGSKDIKLFSIYKDNHGDLWLGTHEAGAYKFNGKTFEKFKP
jgi:ligand-binding sensor domain-containing protein